ncbi:MAG: hypothetical protein ABIG44_12835 [Planctomycetota bacterium]
MAYLGELKKSEKSGSARFCRRPSKQRQPQSSLFDTPHYDDPANDEFVLTLLSGLMPASREEPAWEIRTVSHVGASASSAGDAAIWGR